MPRNKTVYGKRPKPNAVFATSAAFAWSSPAKTGASVPTTVRPDDDVGKLADKLNDVDLRTCIPSEERQRVLPARQKNEGRALKAKDANIVVKVKKSACKSNEGRIVTAANPHSIDQQEEETSAGSKKHQGQAIVDERKTTTHFPRPRTTTIEETPQNISHATAPQALPASTPSDTTSKAASPHFRSIPSPLPLHPHSTRTTPPAQQTEVKLPPSNLAAYAAPLLRLSSDPSARTAPTAFSAWSTSLEPYFSIAKIAEASYGEVYRLSLKEARPGISRADESVLKLIALRPPPPSPSSAATAPQPTDCKNSRKKEEEHEAKLAMMSTVENVRSEVRLLQRMTSTPGFTNFRDVRVLQGRPAGAFVAAWKAFNRGRRRSQKSVFPDPGRKASYGDEQLWAVIEMQDAGKDLENVTVADVWGCWDVFWGVALALGKGEAEARFEHRDLHLGNICVRSTRPEGDVEAPEIRDVNRKLGYTGIETTVIDYTLSRAEMGDTANASDGEAEEPIAYLDLEEDQSLFQGDGAVEYQYDMYRYMRAAMYLDEPLADLGSRWDEAMSTGRTWKGYHPQTNLVWLHFVLCKLLEQISWPSENEEAALEQLNVLEDRKRARRRAGQLEKTLSKLQELLDLENLPQSGLSSVRELIGLALSEGWLDERDVIGVPSADVEELNEKRRRKPRRRKIV